MLLIKQGGCRRSPVQNQRISILRQASLADIIALFQRFSFFLETNHAEIRRIIHPAELHNPLIRLRILILLHFGAYVHHMILFLWDFLCQILSVIDDFLLHQAQFPQQPIHLLLNQLLGHRQMLLLRLHPLLLHFHPLGSFLAYIPVRVIALLHMLIYTTSDKLPQNRGLRHFFTGYTLEII